VIKYGLISETDARTLEKTIDLICESIHNEPINITEIGLYNCLTSTGLMEYLSLKGYGHCNYTGIDCEKDKLIHPPHFMKFIRGNSNEVYNQLEDESQHLIFVDGCHCFAHVVSDFFCYAPKVKTGGYIAFHDTGRHIKPFKDFQHGDKTNPDAYISVRKALYKLQLMGDSYVAKQFMGWELIFDEADETNEAGGICVFKKLY